MWAWLQNTALSVYQSRLIFVCPSLLCHSVRLFEKELR